MKKVISTVAVAAFLLGTAGGSFAQVARPLGGRPAAAKACGKKAVHKNGAGKWAGGSHVGDIVDLRDAGVIDTRVQGSSIRKVSLKVRRRVSYPVTVRIPVGTFFTANSSDAQSMVATEATSATLRSSRWTTVSVATACANRPLHVPDSDNHFSIRRAPQQRELARLIPILQRHGVDFTVRQAAVWIVTDDASFDDLQILVNGLTQSPVIDADAAARAMRLCAEAGINIRRKAIWSDRGTLRAAVHNRSLKRWLSGGG